MFGKLFWIYNFGKKFIIHSLTLLFYFILFFQVNFFTYIHSHQIHISCNTSTSFTIFFNFFYFLTLTFLLFFNIFYLMVEIESCFFIFQSQSLIRYCTWCESTHINLVGPFTFSQYLQISHCINFLWKWRLWKCVFIFCIKIQLLEYWKWKLSTNS